MRLSLARRPIAPTCSLAMVLSFPFRCLLPAGIAAAGLIFASNLHHLPLLVGVVAWTRGDAWASAALGLPFGTLVGTGSVMVLIVLLALRPNLANRPTLPVLFPLLLFASCLITGTLSGWLPYLGAWLRDSLYALIFFYSVYLLVRGPEQFDRMVKVLVVAGLVAAGVNLAELALPGAVRLSHSVGRSAGLLKNANTSAFVLVNTLVLMAMASSPGRSKITTVLLTIARVAVILGVLSTLSREGLLLLFITTAVLTVLEAKGGREAVVTPLALLCAAGIALAASRRMVASGDPTYLLPLAKINLFLHGSFDDNYRLYLASYYTDKFLARPLLGYGFASTLFPSPANGDLVSLYGILGPHNTFVALATEFGIVPLTIYLLFYICLARRVLSRPRSSVRAHALLLLLLLFLHNFFAHDLLVSRPAMVLLALVCLSASPGATEAGRRPDRARER